VVVVMVVVLVVVVMAVLCVRFGVVGVWCLMSEFRGPGFGLLSLGFRV
jgi:hypothetical protein